MGGNKSIAIWCENTYSLYSAKPIVNKYRKKAIVFVYTEEQNLILAARYFKLPSDQIFNISPHKTLLQRKLLLLFQILFIDKNYSFVYRDTVEKAYGRLYKLISKTFFFLKLRKENINKGYQKYNRIITYFGLGPDFEVKGDLVISFTRVNAPYLLSNVKIPHISIMESWDHPVKTPYFIHPDYALTWNQDLRNDTKEYQNISKVGMISPLKFRYIKEKLSKSKKLLYRNLKNDKYIRELRVLKGKNIILYPTTTSSAGLEHPGEMKLINDLCMATENSGYTFYIKPKPNGPSGDYDSFKIFKHVIVGVYSTNTNSVDMLDEDYQTFRYLLLANCNIVINVGTTFVLEAALMKKRILQLNLQTDKYGGFMEFSKTTHLKKYILNDFSERFDGDLVAMQKLIQSVNDDYIDSIKNWLSLT